MNWSDLPFFLAVARAGQLNRAAAALSADATTVGRRIRRLERDLGERLFEQGSQGQELTPAGVSLMDRVEAMMSIATGIGQARAAVRGPVRISVAEGFGTWFVSRHIAGFSDLHPELEIDLVANSGFLNPTRRETDIAVLLAQPRRGPLITRRLTNYGLRLYASRSYLESHPPVARAADLASHRFIGYISDIIYAPELRYIEELPIAVHPELRSSSINAQHALIASHAGVGILPCFIGDADPALARLLPDFRIERSFWLVSHRETHGFPHVQAISNWLVDLTKRHQALLLGKEAATA